MVQVVVMMVVSCCCWHADGNGYWRRAMGPEQAVVGLIQRVTPWSPRVGIVLQTRAARARRHARRSVCVVCMARGLHRHREALAARPWGRVVAAVVGGVVVGVAKGASRGAGGLGDAEARRAGAVVPGGVHAARLVGSIFVLRGRRTRGRE